MSDKAEVEKRRKRDIRKLASVNRRIAGLCNELQSLQQVQGSLEDEIESAERKLAEEKADGGGPKPRKRRTSDEEE